MSRPWTPSRRGIWSALRPCWKNVDNYKDSEKQLNAVRYELAEAALAAENYADARILYNALGSYKDSETKLKQCSYAIASAALTAEST